MVRPYQVVFVFHYKFLGGKLFGVLCERRGAFEVGKASTDSVVTSSILILLFDVILTKLLLQ